MSLERVSTLSSALCLICSQYRVRLSSFFAVVFPMPHLFPDPVEDCLLFGRPSHF